MAYVENFVLKLPEVEKICKCMWPWSRLRPQCIRATHNGNTQMLKTYEKESDIKITQPRTLIYGAIAPLLCFYLTRHSIRDLGKGLETNLKLVCEPQWVDLRL